jgi:uncharacterized protein (TIGR00369 family)
MSQPSLDAVCSRFNAAPYYRLLGMVASSERAGHARVVVPARDELLQLYGGIHGGVLLSIADSAVNIALATTFTADETTATIDLTMSFLAPAGRRDLDAEATILRRGHRIAFGECVIRADGEIVARASGTCYLSRRKP